MPAREACRVAFVQAACSPAGSCASDGEPNDSDTVVALRSLTTRWNAVSRSLRAQLRAP